MKNILRNSNFGFTKWCVALIVAAGMGEVNEASAARLAAWDFFGESSPVTSAADVFDSSLDSSSSLNRGSGAASSSGSNSFRTTGFQNNGIATSNTDYFQFTLSAVDGKTLSLATIDARFAGTASFNASPGVTSQFAYSLDGTTFTLIGSPVQSTSLTLTQISLSGISALQNIPGGTTVTIRYYASGQTTTGGWGFSSSAAGTYGLDVGGTIDGTATTPAAPVVVSASAISTFGFTANWAASSGATKYFLDVATDSGFTSFVTGYQNKDVGNVTSSAVTSLNAGTTYYYRVRANNSAGTSADSQTQVVLTTSAAAPSITPSVASLTALSYNGAGPSTAQSLTLSVVNLAGFPGTVTISGSTNYEVSTTSSSTGFGSSATLSYSDGNTLGSSTVWVRLKAGLAAGSYNGEIIGISGGGATASFTVSGSVTIPVISVTTTNLGNFLGTNGVGSAAKTNTVTGNNLAGAVTMVATNYFQLSSDAGSTYTNTLTLTPMAGVLTNAVLFRIAPDAPVGNLGTNVVTISSPGAADKTVQVAGVVVYGGVTMAIAGASTATVAEGGAPLTMDVTLSAAAPAVGATVTLTTSDADSSELGLSTTSVVFAEGETTKAVTLTPKTDSVFDPSQTIVITATAPDWSVAGTVSVTVSNVDAAPVSTISLTSLAADSYTQNFDGLGTASIADAILGTVGAPTSLAVVTGSSPLNGWYATKILGSATTATAITADNGNGSSGLVYNYGVTGATDRALGVLASGTSTMAIGVLIKNDTGGAIDGIKVSFTAEFWRSSGGASAVQNILACAIGKVDGGTITTANFLTAGSAAPFISGNITGPAAVATSAALNGNDAANQSTFTDVVIPLVLAPGETGFVRWSDVNDGGNDAGLAIDNLRMTAVVNSVPTPEFSLTGGIYLSDQNLKVSNFGAYAPGTTVYYTVDGSTPTRGSTVYNDTTGIALTVGNGPIVVKVIAIQGGLESFITSATYDLPKDVANLASLRASATGSTIYRVTGPVTFTAGTTFRKTKFFQDSGAGIQIDDFGGVITTPYLAGDNVINIVGKIALFNGQLQMVPLQDFGPAVSSGNVVTPLSRTLATLTDADQARLVTILGVEYQGANGTLVFTTPTATINTAVRDNSTGATYSGWVRNIFSDSDVTGKVIPTGAVTLTGIVQKTLIGSVQSLTVGPRNSAEAGAPPSLAFAWSVDLEIPESGLYFDPEYQYLTLSRVGNSTGELQVLISCNPESRLSLQNGGVLPQTIIIPAGTVSTQVKLMPVDNSNYTGNTLVTITATAANHTGATASATILEDEVPDTIKPVIALIGDNPLLLANGATYTDPGATVTDNVDATRTIQGTGTVNTTAAGDYTITYNATDAAGNAAIAVLRTVRVAAPLGTTYSGWLNGASPSDAAFLDYVFGAATPGTLDPTLKPTVMVTGGNLVLTYYVRQGTVGLTVTPKTSDDLAAGPSGWVTTDVTVADVGTPRPVNGVNVQQKTASVPVSGAKKFLRVEAVQQ